MQQVAVAVRVVERRRRGGAGGVAGSVATAWTVMYDGRGGRLLAQAQASPNVPTGSCTPTRSCSSTNPPRCWGTGGTMHSEYESGTKKAKSNSATGWP